MNLLPQTQDKAQHEVSALKLSVHAAQRLLSHGLIAVAAWPD